MQQKRKKLEQVIILTRQTRSTVAVTYFPPHSSSSSLDTNIQNRLRHKLSSVRLSKLNKAPVLEGKPEESMASKTSQIPLITVTVTDPSGQCANAVD